MDDQTCEFISKRPRKKAPSDALIYDSFLPWTVNMGSPRLIFHRTSFFSLCISSIINPRECHGRSDPIMVPWSPLTIELHLSQLPYREKIRCDFPTLFAKVKDAEDKSYGAVVNTFYAIERDYVDYFLQVVKRKAWHVRPVSLLNEDTLIDS